MKSLVVTAAGARIIIGTTLAHNANGAHIRKSRKVLSQIFIHTGFGDFFPINVIRILNNTHLFFGNLADDTDSEAGPGNG